jgi:hypothetical protein
MLHFEGQAPVCFGDSQHPFWIPLAPAVYERRRGVVVIEGHALDRQSRAIHDPDVEAGRSLVFLYLDEAQG